jgi:N-acetylneuraminic acid mutarotase
MQRPLSTLTFFLIICLFATCDDDEETPDPGVITNEVTEIVSGSATLNGELFTGNKVILHHGFFWSSDPNPEFNFSPRHDLGSTTKSGKFQFKLTASLDPNTRYFVRSYIIYNDGQIENIVYGNEVIFLSPSAAAPEITSFEPQHADIGDTILINGNHFASDIQKNEVRFGNYQATLIFASATQLTAIVPSQFDSRAVGLSVSVYGTRVRAEQDFTLNPPELYEVSPSEVYEGQEFYVYGKNFIPFHTTLFVNNDSLEIWSMANDYIASFTSNKLKAGPNTLKVKVLGEEAIMDKKLTNLSPHITSISPQEVTFGEIATLSGSGFSADLWNLTVHVSGHSAEIVSASETEIQFKIPEGVCDAESFVTLWVNNHSTISVEPIKLKAPVISDISPQQGSPGTLVTISGNYFSSYYWSNSVYFNDIQANVISATPTEIVAEVPSVSFGMQEVKVQTCQQSAIATQQFEIAPHEIYDFNPKKGTTGTVITITGKNFATNSSSTYVTIGQFNCEVISSTPDELQVRIWEEVTDNWGLSGQVSVSIGNNTVTSNELFLYTWVRKDYFSWSGRYGAISFSYNDQGYFGMGYEGWPLNDLWSYDGNGHWQQHSNYPGAQTGVYPVSFLIGDEVCVYSADPNLSMTEWWRYNLANNEWESMPQHGTDLFFGTAFSINGKGYLGLGYDRNYNLLNSFYEYKDSAWSEITPFPGEGRTNAVTLEVDGARIVGLGQGGNASLKDLYRFNPLDNSWTQLNDFPSHGRSAATTFTLNNIAYVVGGYYPESSSYPYLNEVWAYDPASDSWEQKSDFAGARSQAASFIANGKVYVGTGYGGWQGGGYKADLWEYHPENDQ